MSRPISPPAGIALTCSPQGTILEVLRDELGFAPPLQAGRMFPSILDRGCFQKGFSFLEELRNRRAAFNWTMNVQIGGEIVPLHFAGGMIGEDILVVGARSRMEIAKLYDELMKINNEQMNLLRQTLKEQMMLERPGPGREFDLYDELSRLNNELATAQRELAKKNAELERLNDLKNQFLGIAAHDLRNPLSIILSYSGFLLEETAPMLNEEGADFLKIIQSSSEFMLDLVNNLLDISRIETGKLELDLASINLLELTRQNVARNRILAEKKGIRLLLRHDEHIPELILDGSKIEQVLNNLIGNAVKFSPPGSTVEIDLALDGNEIRLSVRDHGPGMPAEDLTKIFLPFTKASTRSTGGEKGAGLGLAIAKRIIEGHGGHIGVESSEGAGSAFHISIPTDLFMPAAARGAIPRSDGITRERSE